MKLSDKEIRVVGALVEKELTTPDYYPMSLNGLRNACNQKSNRDPLMNIDESTLLNALDTLRDKGIVIFSSGQGQRVLKYRHDFGAVLSLYRREISLMTSLMLRGAQTLGELRLHSQHLHEFKTTEEVQEYLLKLSEREEPLVKLLPRQPGQKEQRYIHLLQAGAEFVEVNLNSEEEIPNKNELIELQEKVRLLERELKELQKEFYNFKKELET